LKFDVDFFSFVSIFIPLIAGIILFRRVLITTKILILLTTLTAILEIGVATLYYLELNNLFLFHIHTIVEFVLISWIYARLTRSKLFKSIIIILIPIFLLFSLWIVTIENTVGFNSFQRHVEATILVIYILLHLSESRHYRDDRLLNSPFYLYSVVLLMYFVGSLFVFIFANEMFRSGEDTAWVIHGVLNILLNLTIAIVFLKSITRSKN